MAIRLDVTMYLGCGDEATLRVDCKTLADAARELATFELNERRGRPLLSLDDEELSMVRQLTPEERAEFNAALEVARPIAKAKQEQDRLDAEARKKAADRERHIGRLRADLARLRADLTPEAIARREQEIEAASRSAEEPK